MTSWSLAQHGDRIEKKWGVKIMERFPLYETFWALHVVPLTYRVSDPSCLYVRSTVHKELTALATASYGVFVHLAACHEQLESDPDLFAAVGIYPFYSRLYSVGELVKKFLGAVRPVLRRYRGTFIPDLNRCLDYYGTPGLSARFKEAFEKRAKDYRG